MYHIIAELFNFNACEVVLYFPSRKKLKAYLQNFFFKPFLAVEKISAWG